MGMSEGQGSLNCGKRVNKNSVRHLIHYASETNVTTNTKIAHILDSYYVICNHTVQLILPK
jgi:hypothetical protein